MRALEVDFQDGSRGRHSDQYQTMVLSNWLGRIFTQKIKEEASHKNQANETDQGGRKEK